MLFAFVVNAIFAAANFAVFAYSQNPLNLGVAIFNTLVCVFLLVLIGTE